MPIILAFKFQVNLGNLVRPCFKRFKKKKKEKCHSGVEYPNMHKTLDSILRTDGDETQQRAEGPVRWAQWVRCLLSSLMI